jgi:uncharacterized protein YjbI with pentapeptide repeats
MNQQKPDPTRPRQRRVSAQTQSPSHSMPQPREKHATRPAQNDHEGWKAYWEERQQIWRTEPEIDQQRQEELEHYRVIVPDIEKGIYPFKGVELSRADVEWLLATHEQGRGPVYWNDESQRERKGLDLRGASLQQVNLDNLPLARLQAGLGENEWLEASEEQRMQAGICLQGASLRKTRLEGASLSAAQLEEANLYRAQLKETELAHAQLRKADLYRAQLEITNLSGAHLEDATLRSALLKETYLPDAILSDERRIGPLLADVQWESTNLALVDWSQMMILGDEEKARQKSDEDGEKKSGKEILHDYQKAVRANRQLAVALQEQGLNEEAARFAYRAQLLQKTVFRLQIGRAKNNPKLRLQSLRAWLFSWFLFLIAGYGYKPGRSFLAYLLVISGFATTYYILGHTIGPLLSPLGAFIFSMTSFHGRGFFPGNNISLDDPLTVLAAFEALVGLIIEVTFIATLTQRFFNR